MKIWDTLKNTLKHDIGPFKDIRCVCFLADSKESLLGFGTADSVVVFDCSRGENYVVLVRTLVECCSCNVVLHVDLNLISLLARDFWRHLYVLE